MLLREVDLMRAARGLGKIKLTPPGRQETTTPVFPRQPRRIVTDAVFLRIPSERRERSSRLSLCARLPASITPDPGKRRDASSVCALAAPATD